MNKEQREQLASDLLAEAEHRRGRVVDLLRNAATALSTPDAQQARQPGQVVWVNPEELELCQTKPIYMDEHNELLNGMPRQIAALAARSDHCCLALTPATPPAAQVQGEQPEVIGTLVIGDQGWDNAIELSPGPVMALAEKFPQSSMPLMTVAQHDRIVADNVRWKAVANEQMQVIAGLQEQLRAALSAPPAAGMPEGLKADLYEIAGQILNIAHATHKPVSHTLMAPIRDYTLKDAQSVARVAGERLVGIADRIAAPTPPASEQQRAVEMPEPFMFVKLHAGDVMDWTQDPSLAEYWAEEGDTVAELYSGHDLRLTPNLQPAAPSQGGE
jgi:hypothetical protein